MKEALIRMKTKEEILKEIEQQKEEKERIALEKQLASMKEENERLKETPKKEIKMPKWLGKISKSILKFLKDFFSEDENEKKRYPR